MADEGQPSEQNWTWPERKVTGEPSSPTSPQGLDTVPSEPGSQLRQDWAQQLPGEDNYSFQIRSAVVVTVASLITTAVTFGVNISSEQAVALIGTVTTVSSLVAIVLSDVRRRRRG